MAFHSSATMVQKHQRTNQMACHAILNHHNPPCWKANIPNLYPRHYPMPYTLCLTQNYWVRACNVEVAESETDLQATSPGGRGRMRYHRGGARRFRSNPAGTRTCSAPPPLRARWLQTPGTGHHVCRCAGCLLHGKRGGEGF